MDHTVLERLGLSWTDTVCEANEKRVCEYDRQLEEAIDYADKGYKADWENRVPAGVSDLGTWMVENRRVYEAGFVTDERNTQLAVSIPIDEPLRSLLSQARDDVVNSLLLSSGAHGPDMAADIHTSPTWVPRFAHIPAKDLHVTICIPSLWRIPDKDPAVHRAYNESVAAALSHAAADHEAFVLEVDRIMLGKDGSLLAVFRTVGLPAREGLAEILGDRASEQVDPMSSLRSDVLYVFLERKLSKLQRSEEVDLAAIQSQPKLLRQATIVKTVGGSVHGYIHCSLSRLAIGPGLTEREVDMKMLQRICRSWTAKLAGRRMAVRGFKLTEMTGLGAGGNKNPFDHAKWSQDIRLNTKSGALEAKKLRRFRVSCGCCFPWLDARGAPG